ncbi:hypothetical protein DCAR_0728683 [Daucus carota subsp. sativus]|uniref:TF-B3 domain-containing protein n=1 Tax=Daucus carota subsp. sativus TaxID=79200 RepID=A0A161ZNI9_DAUCS|nr:hypothetical protein DCAR_0728683 [Daucus carota subsp. sativus]
MEVAGFIAERFLKYVTEHDLFTDEIGGLSCVKFLTETDPVLDELVVPASFIHICVSQLSLRCFVDYVLSNGKKVAGGYTRSTLTFTGFQRVGECLGIHDLNTYNMLLLKYESNGDLSVGVFDDSFVEVLSNGTPLSPVFVDEDGLCFLTTVGCGNTVVDDIDVVVKFRKLSLTWDPSDSIMVYKENQKWSLNVRKKKKHKTTMITNGWIQLRQDLELHVGDIVVFDWKDDRVRSFDVRVLRYFYAM